MSEWTILQKLHFLHQNMTLDDIKAKSKNKSFELLFNHIEKLDRKADGVLDSHRVFNIDAPFLQGLDTYVVTKKAELSEQQKKIKDYNESLGFISLGENEGHFELDDTKIAKYIDSHADLKGVSVQDLKDFFDVLVDINDEKDEIESREYEAEQLKRNPNVPKEIALHTGLDEKLSVTKKDGKTYYDIEDEEGHKRRYNTEGTLVALESEALAISDGDGYWNTLGKYREMMLFDEKTEKQIGEIRRYKGSNVVDRETYADNTMTRTLGKTEFNYKDNKLQSIKINNGLPNETELECEYDENGNIKDFKISQKDENKAKKTDSNNQQINNPIKFSNEEKNLLKNMLNSGLKFGEDFSLDMDCNQLKLNPIVKNKSNEPMPPMPDSLRQELLKYAQQGLRNNRDYSLSYNNGKYEIDFNSAKARDYVSDEKRITYSQDGKTKTTTTVNGDEITTAIESGSNQSISSMSRKDAFLEKLVMSDYKGLDEVLGDVSAHGSDFDFYALAKDYQNMTGKSLMQDIMAAYDKKLVDKNLVKKLVPNIHDVMFMGDFTPEQKEKYFKEAMQNAFDENEKALATFKSFDISQTEVGKMIYKSERQNISDNKYVETSNGIKYTVTRNKDSITIEKNGKSFTIDLKGIHQNLQNMIFNSNSNVIYQIASNGIKFGVFSDLGKVNPKNSNGYYDPQTKTIMLNTETQTGSKMKRTLAHEAGHFVYGYDSKVNEKLEASFKEEKAAFMASDEPYKEGNQSYCATHVYEMVAECYALLTTGHSKSEYIIAKYFPKTFAIIKQMIEEQNR